MYSVSSSTWLSLIVCCVFSIGNGPRRNRPPTIAASQFPLSQYYCYWVSATKASYCAIHKSSVLRQSSLLSLLQVHHSPIISVATSTSVVPIFTVPPSSSAPFTNLPCCAFYKGCTNLQCCAFYKCCTHHHCRTFYSCPVRQCCSICQLPFCAMC